MNKDIFNADTEESDTPKSTCNGRVTSPYLADEATLMIDKDGLLADALFEQDTVSCADYTK